MFGCQKTPELFPRIALGDNPVKEVRAVIAGGEDRRVGEPELRHDVAPRGFVGGCRQRHQRHARKALLEDRKLLVFWPEIVAPLRDAMGFVDGDQGKAAFLEHREAARRQQPLGRDVEEVEPGIGGVALDC